MPIVQATIDHLNDLFPLFDAYRVFYKQDSNAKAARDFLYDRLTKNDTVIFLAYIDKKAVGFVQLFPSFSSVSVQPLYILNDLYVDKAYRKRGIGVSLLNRAKQLCKEENCKGLSLQTGKTNSAQHLYERLGWKKDQDLFYFWHNEHLNL